MIQLDATQGKGIAVMGLGRSGLAGDLDAHFGNVVAFKELLSRA